MAFKSPFQGAHSQCLGSTGKASQDAPGIRVCRGHEIQVQTCVTSEGTQARRGLWLSHLVKAWGLVGAPTERPPTLQTRIALFGLRISFFFLLQLKCQTVPELPRVLLCSLSG